MRCPTAGSVELAERPREEDQCSDDELAVDGAETNPKRDDQHEGGVRHYSAAPEGLGEAGRKVVS